MDDAVQVVSKPNPKKLESVRAHTNIGIDGDPLELVRYAEGECQAWFTANRPEDGLTTTPIIASQGLCFKNICMVDDLGPVHRSSVDADGFGKITLDKHNLWV
ncbi:hypothetical protein Bca4012_030604 [Brassica carinata]